MVLAVAFGRREELVERDVDHDAGDGRKDVAKHVIGEEGGQDEVADESTDGFGQSGEKGETEGADAIAGGVEDGHRHGDAFGDIVDGDGHGDGDGELGVFEGGDEGDHSLGEVVDGQHEGGDQPGAQQAVVAEGLGLMPHALLGAHLLDIVHFVRVFGLRHEEVDDEDEEDAAEEGQRGERAAHLGAVEGGEGADGVGQEFDKGDVNHHPG